jgi:hypothetical protein
MRNRKALGTSVFAALFTGIIGVMHLMEQPRFQSYHNVDVLQLIASGMCFGVALSGLLVLMRRAKTS